MGKIGGCFEENDKHQISGEDGMLIELIKEGRVGLKNSVRSFFF